MPPRRQRTEQPASLTPERDDEQVEVPETQPEVRIPIRSASESGPSLSQPTAADVQDPAPLSEDVNMADVVEGQEEYSIEQLKRKGAQHSGNNWGILVRSRIGQIIRY